jgi:hypothetical protein
MWWIIDCKPIKSMYCAVRTERESEDFGALEIIKETAPILHKFVGQPIGNLRKWIDSKGGCCYRMDWR